MSSWGEVNSRKKKEKEGQSCKICNLLIPVCSSCWCICLCESLSSRRTRIVCCVYILCTQPKYSVNICEANEAGAGREQMFVENLL